MARQMRIEGTEGKKIKELDEAMAKYVDVRDKRMKLTEKEVEAQAKLVELMETHKVNVYKDEDASPPLVVELKPGKTKAKVKQLGAAEEEDD